MKPKRKATFTYLAVGILTLLLSAALPNHAIAQTCAPPPTGIIAWWPLDEPSGTGAADIAGGSPGIHVNGPTPAAGKVDGALHFTRPQYVGVADSDSWAFGRNDFTIEFWANFDGLGGGSLGHPEDIFIGNDEGPGTLNKWFFALGGGDLNFHINGPGVGSFFLVQAPFSPVPGQWYHLAVTRSNNTFTILVNGNMVGSETRAISIPNPNAPLTIGQAEGNAGASGFMDGSLDEVTIYNRALAQLEVVAIVNAGRAGKCRLLSISTRSVPPAQIGDSFSYQLASKFGVVPLTWSLSSGTLPPGIELTPDGIIAGTPSTLGHFLFTARVTDSNGVFAERTLSLDVLLTPPPPSIRAHKTGTLAVPGRVMDYFIAVENLGDVPATDIYLHELLDPSNFVLLSAKPEPALPLSTLAGASIIIWAVPALEPGGTQIFTYQVLLNPTVPFGTDIVGPAYPIRDLYKLARCLAGGILSSGICGSCLVSCGLAIGTCEIEPLTCPALVEQCETCIGACVRGLVGLALAKCYDNPPGIGAIHTQKAQGPHDPNEKLVTTNRFIPHDQLLVYPIHFENVGTVEARDIFVTDILDSNLDLSTLIFLTPNGASLDLTGRTIKWSLVDRNLKPNETGNVLLAVRPLPSLPSGTEIRNKARIQFENFSPMDTNEVVNIIDDMPPECVMNPLPAVSTALTIPLSWSGTDAVGEIDTYSVLVSTNGGPYAPLVEHARTTSMTFLGVAGNSYGFSCIATDTAGNVEVQQAAAETMTLVQPDTKPPTITISASPAILWPPNGRMVSIMLSGRIEDTETGVNATKISYAVSDEYGVVEPTGAVTLGSDGRYSFTILLQASRDGEDRDGRHYSISVRGQDNAGNIGSASTDVTVPHDRR